MINVSKIKGHKDSIDNNVESPINVLKEYEKTPKDIQTLNPLE